MTLPAPYQAAVLRFTYDDAWYPVTDGFGKSLVFADPTLPVALWRSNEFWGASLEDGGNPAVITGSSSATVTDVTTTIPADPVHFYQIRALLAP